MNADNSTSETLSRTRYGATHPERVENTLWEGALRQDWSGYRLREHLGVESGNSQNPSYSAYRNTVPGPFWSWQRFGRTSTPLPDGRVIHIAGEHEDAYDADFCIYNDVVVEHPDGRHEFFLYPKDIFPPTDFHSATLVADEILLIGSLGYRDLRRVGETQVLKLDTRTLRIEPVVTAGETPGWISRHLAERLGESVILVIGGMIEASDGYEPNTGVFALDLTTMTWSRRTHGDLAIFPISEALYRKHKNPSYGRANPERSDNAFWLEMARRRWAPSRARLHYGDFAPPRPELILSKDPSDLSRKVPESGTPEAEAWFARISADIERSKLVRTMDDVIWTAMREQSLDVTLPDGRWLRIGGEIPDYGDEYADPWIYNDVIVTHANGAIEILAYPKDIVPHATWSIAAVLGDFVYMFGHTDRDHHPDRSRRMAILRLDTSSYAMEELSVAAPPMPVMTYQGAGVRESNRIVFPIRTKSQSDPELCIAFDLEALAWGEPFPHPHPAVQFDD